MDRVVVQVWYGDKSAGYVTMNTIKPLVKDLQEAAVFWSRREAHRWVSKHQNLRGIIEKDTTFTYDIITLSVAEPSLDIQWENTDTGC